MEEAALAALDLDALMRDAADLVRVPSVTGDERAALELVAERAAAAGLAAELYAHDLAALRALPGHPGEEAPRDALWGVTATLEGSVRGRLCLNGHVDVVGPGTKQWQRDPWSGAIEAGRLHGRGAVDMKAAVVAALHALAALRRAGVQTPEVVLQAVASEEDGGLGTFAALDRDAAFDAALLPEPTGLRVVCAQAGALTFRGVVPGRSAHAAERLAGCSAIDRYVRVHAALAAHEVAVNTRVEHPLMRELAAPLPAARRARRGRGLVEPGAGSARVRGPARGAGRRRPRRRAGSAAAPGRRRARRRRGAVRADCGRAERSRRARPRRSIRGSRPCAAHCATSSGGEPPLAGVPWGADMRLFTARGIPR